jgi:transposase InsO family protein
MYAHVEAEVKQSGKLPLKKLCAVAAVSRAGYYRWRQPANPSSEASMDLRSALQQTALAMPAYGYRRITADLRQQGWRVNRKRVLRMMREDNLLCVRRRRFVRTTDSDHGLPVYPNLAGEMEVQRVDQLWVADITYIRLRWEFIYLAVILDAFSRRVIGWNLGRNLRTELALGALKQALSTRQVTAGLVHHSDRGIQYASHLYTECLRQHQVKISMSRRGNPYDNAFAESFMKTLKHEEVYRSEYATLEQAQQQIGRFLEEVYNRKRLHSALQYRSPQQFEDSLQVHSMAGVGPGAQTPPLAPHPHPGFNRSSSSSTA